MTSLFNIALVALLVSESPAQRINKQPDHFANVSRSSIYISEWENNLSWNATTDQSTFFSKRNIPQLTKEVLNNGVIMVFTKGYNFTEANLPEKPLQMPFYFFPTNGSVNDVCKWLITKAPGEIELGLKVPEEVETLFQQARKNVQLRYFIFDEAFLKQNKLTKNVIQNMSYQQLVKLVNVTP